MKIFETLLWMQVVLQRFEALRRGIPVVLVKQKMLNMYRYTVRTQLCHIIRYYTTHQLHVSVLTWPSSGCTKLYKVIVPHYQRS